MSTTLDVNFNDDLLDEILSRLHKKKSLERFKFVNKKWSSLISHPLFVNKHIVNSLKPKRDIFLKELAVWKDLPGKVKRTEEESSGLPLFEAVFDYFLSANYAATNELEDLQTLIHISKEVLDVLKTAQREIGIKCRLLDNVAIELIKIPDAFKKVKQDVAKIDEVYFRNLNGTMLFMKEYNVERKYSQVAGLDYEALIDIVYKIEPYLGGYDFLQKLVDLGKPVLKNLEDIAASSRNKKGTREEGDGRVSGSGSSTTSPLSEEEFYNLTSQLALPSPSW